MKKTEFQYRNVDELIPYVNNAKIHNDEQVTQVASSIKEFGFLSPIVVTSDNTILAGHCRVLASKKLGIKEVPCVIESHLTDAQRRAYILADNRLSENADWDMELVKNELERLNDEDFNLDLTGFDLNEIIDAIGEDDGDIEENDEIPEPPVEPVTKKGDIWILGDHRLVCGDATNFDDVDKLMRGGGYCRPVYYRPSIQCRICWKNKRRSNNPE